MIGGKPGPALADPRSAAERLEKALSGSITLPLLPTTAQRAMDLMKDSDVAISEFTRLIETDAALAAALLKVANSMMYSWGRTIASLDQAVMRLGLLECSRLMVAIGVRSLANKAPASIQPRCRLLWQHSFVVACLCRRIGRELNCPYDGEEFTAGLLHDLGRIVLALLLPDVFLVVDPVTFHEDEGLLEREREILGHDHCAVGALFAEQSRMPRTVIGAIRSHHEPARASMCRGLVELVATADHLANHFNRGLKIEDYNLSSNAGFAGLSREMNDRRKEEFRAKLPEMLTEASQALASSGLN